MSDNEVTIREFYITFGVQYPQFPKEGEEPHPLGMHCNGYAVIEAPGEFTARDIANSIFGKQWAFCYDEKPEPRWAPEGELMRVAWQQEGVARFAS
jgi:hypothetical protein